MAMSMPISPIKMATYQYSEDHRQRVQSHPVADEPRRDPGPFSILVGGGKEQQHPEHCEGGAGDGKGCAGRKAQKQGQNRG